MSLYTNIFCLLQVFKLNLNVFVILQLQQNNMHMQELAAAEPMIRHHCHCMNRCQQVFSFILCNPPFQLK